MKAPAHARVGPPGVAEVAALCTALADPTRLRILSLLGDGELCVCHIHDSLDIPQPTASRHLASLRRAGLVETRRDGLWVHYRLADSVVPHLRQALDAVLHAVGHCGEPASDEAHLARATGRARRLLPVTAAGCCTTRRP